MGHSRGGCTAIVKASLDPRLKCLVTWASPAALGRDSDEVLRQWKEDGRYNFVNARTKQDMFVDYAYLEDIEANRERYSLDLAVSQLTIPYLTVHGTTDESVALMRRIDCTAIRGPARRSWPLWKVARTRWGRSTRLRPRLRPWSRPSIKLRRGFVAGSDSALLMRLFDSTVPSPALLWQAPYVTTNAGPQVPSSSGRVLG